MYYAVKKGRRPGLYTKWKEFEAQVNGYNEPEFKGFDRLDQALEWLEGRKLDPVDIYTDGSYNDKTEMCGAGFVVVMDEQIVYESSCSFPDKYGARNVFGETGAVIKAIQWAKENGINTIRINHDYVGVAKWVTGEWKRKKGMSGKYYDKFCKLSAGMYISFRWVKGHSGNKWNNAADKLAGNAVK